VILFALAMHRSHPHEITDDATRKRRPLVRLIILSAIVALGIVVFVVVQWQLAKLSSEIRTMPVEGAQDVLLSAYADVVLDQSVLGQLRNDNPKSEPILDEYTHNPGAIKQRAVLVRTWLNAGLLVKDLGNHGLQEHQIVSSNFLPQVSVDHRSDGWRNPYCVLSYNGKIAVLSGGEKGPLKCDGLAGTAQRLTTSISTHKLERLPNGILFTIQDIRPQKD